MKKNIVALKFPGRFDSYNIEHTMIVVQEPFVRDLDFDGNYFISFELPDLFWDGVIWAVGYYELLDLLKSDSREFFEKLPKQVEQDIIEAYKTGIVPRAPYIMKPILHYDYSSFFCDLSIEKPSWHGTIWFSKDLESYEEYEDLDRVKSIILRTFAYIHQGIQEPLPLELIEEPVEPQMPMMPLVPDFTKICPFCQVVNESNAGYCKACGAPWGIALEANRKQK